MICCVSPADSNYHESLNAVKYANRARNIRNKPIVNLDPTAMIIQELRGQIKVLAIELLAHREGRHIPGDNDMPIGLLNDLAASKQVHIPPLSGTNESVPPRKSPIASTGSKAQIAISHTMNDRSVARTNMEAIKYEQECIVLRSRLQDSDQEVQRITEKQKRTAMQISELTEQLVIVQSERDYFRMKLNDVTESSDSVHEGERERSTRINIIADYIREIESLKALNAKLQIERTNQWAAIKSYEVGNFAEEIAEWTVGAVEEGDMSGVANVISSTEEQVLREKRLLEKIERGGSDDSEDDDTNIDVNRTETMAEKDRNFQRRQRVMAAEVQELNESIQLKELLVMQLQRSQQQYLDMKTFYEHKLDTLCAEMEAKEKEKQKVLDELHELSLRSEVASVKQGREDRLREKLESKEQELLTMRARQLELSHLSKVQSRSSEQLKKLEADISSMKRQRVDLARTLQLEKKAHLSALNMKAKEVDHLKRELTRAMQKVRKLGDEKERAEMKAKEMIRDNISRRKRESAGTNGTTSNSAPLQTMTARDSRRVLSQHASNSSGGRILSAEEIKTKKWLDKQVRVIAARENAAEALRLQCEQQLALLHQKKQLEEFREPLRAVILKVKRIEGGDMSCQEDKNILSVDEEEALADCEEKISKLEGQLKYRNAEISRMELELKSDKRLKTTHQSTVEMLKHNAASSLPAAHQLIHLLFDIVVSTRKAARIHKDRLEASQEREYRLNEDLDDALTRLNLEKRHHEKELARVERDFEERLAGLYNHSNLGAVISPVENSEGDRVAKKAAPASWMQISG